MNAEVKISELDLAGALNDSDYFEIVQNGKNVRIPFSAIIRLSNLVSVGTITTGVWNAPTLKRTTSVATAAAITPNMDNIDMFLVTAIDQALTINAPAGTPTEGQVLIIRIKDNGVSQSLTWSGSYRAFGTSLPATTTTGKTTYVTIVSNRTDNKWDVIEIKTQS